MRIRDQVEEVGAQPEEACSGQYATVVDRLTPFQTYSLQLSAKM